MVICPFVRCRLLLALFDPGSHDLSGQPVSTDLGLDHGWHAAWSRAQWVCSPGEQERSDVGAQGLAGLNVAVVLGIDGMAEQGPPVAAVVLDVVTGVEQITKPREVFVLDGEVRWRPRHGDAPLA
jgi:hypothetical protein